MEGYLKIYIKKDRIGHVRYEIGDDRGNKEIRGLSVNYPNLLNILTPQTIYEKGEEDSHGISIYDEEYYLPSEEIPLEREELVQAIAYTKTNDEKEQKYGLYSNNCNDFTAGLLSAVGKKGCVGDYLTKEQKDSIHLSQLSDLDKCQIPREVKATVDKVKKSACSGLVQVGSYMRLGEPVEAYTRSCGRH